MIATYVHPRLTPMTFEQAALAMKAGLRAELGRDPSLEVLALALAKCALETGRFRAIWNWNFGNIKAGPKYPGMFTCIELNEVLREKGRDVVVWFSPEGKLDKKGGKVVAERSAVPPGHPQTRMRAHANEFDGAMRYAEFMHRDAAGNVRPMWKALLLGEPVAFVRAMKAAGYFTAPEAAYAKAVGSLFKEFRLKLEGKAPELAPDLPEDDKEWRSLRAVTCALQAEYARGLVEKPGDAPEPAPAEPSEATA
jgi:hypothetical protein